MIEREREFLLPALTERESFFYQHLQSLYIFATPKGRFPKLVKTHRSDGLGVNANLKLG